MAKRFTDKVALVTGGGTGIGAAIAEQLAAEGASIAICGRRTLPLEAMAARLQERGTPVLAVPADVSTDVEELIDAVVERFTRLDVIVNNAAVSAGLTVEEMSYRHWRHVLAVNLDAAFQLVKCALPYLSSSRGNVLHISSISSVAGEFDDIAYSVSKAGLESLSRKLALELSPVGVRSNVIRPGLIMTRPDESSDHFYDSQKPLIPLGIVGEPRDIAAAAAFLCSDEARFITGAVLTVDGGESVK